MMKEFFKENRFAIINPMIFSGIFLLLFVLFDLDITVFYIGISLSIIYLIFALMYLFLRYKSSSLIFDKLKKNNAELKELIEISSKKQSDLEEYFLLWVHQIKTPITAGKLLLEEANELNVTELKKQFIRIEDYSNMAMNYVKVSNPDTDMDFSSVNLHKLILPIIQRYSIEFISNRIRLHYIPIEASVLTDAKLASIMIEQIINNALKYTKNGDIWIYYSEENKTLSIRDNGCGILAENIPKIFDKGYSGFNGRLNQKSSGLGLYLVKLIANRLDHQISVDSEIKKGSVFSIKFSKES